jgi:tetratricopeptide (TPR) repeat protein
MKKELLLAMSVLLLMTDGLFAQNEYATGLAHYKDKEYSTALGWLQKAAAQGNDSAMYLIGGMYANGESVSRDFDLARDWYVKAAEKGHVEAMYNLGLLYYNRYSKLYETVKWLRPAADRNSDAAAMLNRVLQTFQFDEGLSPVDADGKLCFIDERGNIVVSPKFEPVYRINNTGKSYLYSRFNSGLAPVGEQNQYGFIDKTGAAVIPIQYSDARVFSDGLAPVKMGVKWGFINTSGAAVIPFKYDEAESFSEGLAAVKVDGKWGFINRSGSRVIPFKYDRVGNFSNGKANVELKSEMFNIDEKGRKLK